jgi:hypothetical protein
MAPQRMFIKEVGFCVHGREEMVDLTGLGIDRMLGSKNDLILGYLLESRHTWREAHSKSSPSNICGHSPQLESCSITL